MEGGKSGKDLRRKEGRRNAELIEGRRGGEEKAGKGKGEEKVESRKGRERGREGEREIVCPKVCWRFSCLGRGNHGEEIPGVRSNGVTGKKPRTGCRKMAHQSDLEAALYTGSRLNAQKGTAGHYTVL